MLEIFFPETCAACKEICPGKICKGCISEIEFLEEYDYCNTCGEPFTRIDKRDKRKNICMRCVRDEFWFEKARSVALHSGVIKELLHKFKYRDKLILSKALCEIIYCKFPGDILMFELAIPVPLHLSKLRKREFNQSSLFAKNIARRFNCRFDPFNLYKIRENRPQFEMENINERKKNVRGVFKAKDRKKLRGLSILLVDDVFTTGSTVNECARVMYQAGADKVQVLTLTRAHY